MWALGRLLPWYPNREREATKHRGTPSLAEATPETQNPGATGQAPAFGGGAPELELIGRSLRNADG